MDGPGHYRRSEELAEKARDHLDRKGAEATAASYIALAQVHATLAAAAAAADRAPGWEDLLHPQAAPLQYDSTKRPGRVKSLRRSGLPE
jgi:hypothetical protein